MSESTFNVALLAIAGLSIYIAFCIAMWRKSETIPLERADEPTADTEGKHVHN